GQHTEIRQYHGGYDTALPVGMGEQVEKRRQAGTGCFWRRLYLGRHTIGVGVLNSTTLLIIDYSLLITHQLISNIYIRRAAAADCPRILELVRELADYEKAPQEVTVSLSHFTESGFGSNPVWWGFVAEAEGQIVAFTLYYIRFS